ncbi:Oxysterol-binding protein 3 [Sorochytrium milnesiophthora]
MQEIEIPARDRFKYYVQVTDAPKTIMWNFTTKRNNVAFGLFRQNDGQASGDAQNPLHHRTTSDASTASQTRMKGILPFSRSRSNIQQEAASPVSATMTDDNDTDSANASSSTDLSKRRHARAVSGHIRDPQLSEIMPVEKYESAKGTIKGQYTVDQDGTYVLYFDNSFSRNTSKKLTFFVAIKDGTAQEEKHEPELTGYLLKKKRKKMQGWAKRYFVCDRGQLSYFKFPAGFCRGSIPISLSTISIDADHRIINIDSGSSLWHLRAFTREDYDKWIAVIRNYKSISVEALRNSTNLSPENARSQSPDGMAAGVGLSISDSLDTLIQHTFDTIETKVTLIATALQSEELKQLDKKRSSKGDEHGGVAGVAKMARDCLDMLSRQRVDVLDLLDCEVAKSKTLEAAYQAIIAENTDHRRRLGMEMPSPLRSVSRDSLKAVPHNRSNSITSSSHGSDAFFDAEDALLSGAHDSSDEEMSTKEMVIYENDEDDEDSDDSLSDVQSFAQTSTSSLPQPNTNGRPTSAVPGHGNGHPVKHDASHDSSKAVVKRRTYLPSPVVGNEVSLLSILRKNMGKDLSAISMPISLNEPLNLLQKLCEDLEYSELLDKAAGCGDSIDRLMYVAAFAVSAYGSTALRSSRKPFNPLHGETYECVRPDKGFRFVSEKVSHQPPIMACHASSPNYEFHQDNKVKSKFWGKSMEFIPSGTVHVRLPKTGDHYTWSKVTSCMRNIIGGQKSIDHYGKMTITNHATGERAELMFKENGGGGYFSSGGASNKNEVVGGLYDARGSKVRGIHGRWSEQLFAEMAANTLEVIWRVNPPVPNCDEYYGFTKFAMELNELTPDIAPVLPQTDTRFRPDQRMFEDGKLEAAEAEKIRLEEKQRTHRRELEAEGRPWVPEWFEMRKDEHTGEDQWMFKGHYWKARETGSWPSSINLCPSPSTTKTVVRVNSINSRVEREVVEKLFSFIGPVKYLHVNPSLFVPGTQEAIVEFRNADDATLALQLSGVTLVDRPLVVMRQTMSVTDIPPVISLNVNNPMLDPGKRERIACTIYIRDLSPLATEDDVVQFFSAAGKVELVKVVGEADNPAVKRFAFLEFTTSDAADNAVAMNGQELLGMPLKCVIEEL